MKRYYALIITLIQVMFLISSCEKVIHVERDETGMIHVHSMPGYGDTLRVDLAVTKPLFGDEEARYDDIDVFLKADGTPLKLIRDEDYKYKPSSGWSFYTTETLHSGQVLTLTAEVDGIPAATAETTVPKGFPEVRVEQVKEYSFKYDRFSPNNKKRQTVWTFKIEIDEEYEEGQYFGVQVLRNSYIKWFGDVFPGNSEMAACEDLFAFTGMSRIYTMPVGDTFSSLSSEMVMEINDADLMIVKNYGSGKVSFEVSVEYMGKILADGSYIGDVMQYEAWLFHRYKVFIYRLSEECHNCLMAGYMNSNPGTILSEIGMSPGISTYTNVNGGLGMFGAVSEYESEWMEVKE